MYQIKMGKQCERGRSEPKENYQINLQLHSALQSFEFQLIV